MSHERGVEMLDDVWAGRFVYEPSEERLYRQLLQPSRNPILERNATLRREGVVQDRPFVGRWCLTIPLWDFERLCRDPRWAGLKSRDSKEKQETWRRFLLSPEAEPFRVRDNAC